MKNKIEKKYLIVITVVLLISSTTITAWGIYSYLGFGVKTVSKGEETFELMEELKNTSKYLESMERITLWYYEVAGDFNVVFGFGGGEVFEKYIELIICYWKVTEEKNGFLINFNITEEKEALQKFSMYNFSLWLYWEDWEENKSLLKWRNIFNYNPLERTTLPISVNFAIPIANRYWIELEAIHTRDCQRIRSQAYHFTRGDLREFSRKVSVLEEKIKELKVEINDLITEDNLIMKYISLRGALLVLNLVVLLFNILSVLIFINCKDLDLEYSEKLLFNLLLVFLNILLPGVLFNNILGGLFLMAVVFIIIVAVMWHIADCLFWI